MTERRITIRVPDDLHRKARIKAAVTGRSVSDVLRDALQKWVEEDDQQQETNEPTT